MNSFEKYELQVLSDPRDINELGFTVNQKLKECMILISIMWVKAQLNSENKLFRKCLEDIAKISFFISNYFNLLILKKRSNTNELFKK